MGKFKLITHGWNFYLIQELKMGKKKKRKKKESNV